MQNLHGLQCLTRTGGVAFATPPKVGCKSTWHCTRIIPSTIQTYTFLGAFVSILTSSLLKRVDLSVDISSLSICAKVEGTEVCYKIWSHFFLIKTAVDGGKISFYLSQSMVLIFRNTPSSKNSKASIMYHLYQALSIHIVNKRFEQTLL